MRTGSPGAFGIARMEVEAGPAGSIVRPSPAASLRVVQVSVCRASSRGGPRFAGPPDCDEPCPRRPRGA
eukprot:3458840-Pyramimonas_sp.AAC.1